MENGRKYFIQESILDIDERFGPAWEVRYCTEGSAESIFFASCGYADFGKENAETILKALAVMNAGETK